MKNPGWAILPVLVALLVALLGGGCARDLVSEPPRPESAATSLPTSDLRLADSLEPPRTDPLLEGISPADIARAQALAKRDYLPHWKVVAERSRYVRQRLLRELERLHAPSSLELIPVVESGYNPYALSHAGAMGLWQLMPATARSLGIERNRHRNGRREVGQATRAAAQYLMAMHDRFDSWPLAIAAYHMGPYGLARRLRQSPWTAGDGLDAMPAPAITRAYVKHVLGLVALRRMGTLVFPEPWPTREITLPPPVDLVQLSRACGFPERTLFLFNPGLNQAQYFSRPISLHVPADRYTDVLAAAEHLGPRYVQQKVLAGDSLWRIARQHRISVAHLKRLNPGLGHVLHPGQLLKVPANLLAKASASANPLLSQGRRIRYRVRRGDSLWSIAQRFGTSARAIARSNQLSQSALIRPGDTLWILARIRPS